MSSFGAWLAVIAVAAFAIRLAYLFAIARHQQLGLDSVWYTLVSGSLAHGKGVIDPRAYFGSGRAIVTASHAPLYPAFLAGITRLFNGDYATFRLVGAVAGTLTVVLTGSIGKRIGGAPVGLVAAALVAVFPSLIAVDGALMSETVAIPLLLGAVWVALVAIERPTWWRFGIVGALLGLTMLARADALVVAVCVVVPMAMLAARRWSRRCAFAVIAIGGLVIVVMPWVMRNEAHFGRFLVATTSTSRTVAGANCSASYGGALIGDWDAACGADPLGPNSEIAVYDEQMTRGIDYARGHMTRLPLVVVVRELREFGLFRPRQQAHLEAIETRSYHWQLLAWACWLPAMALGTAGFVVMIRRRVRSACMLLGVVASVVLVAAFGHGNQRFRTACEPVVLVAAAVAIVRERRGREPLTCRSVDAT
jgi:dolichyl-phosphate-mannose-protein mannosyltransferase